VVEKRLGSLAQRLAASVGQTRFQSQFGRRSQCSPVDANAEVKTQVKTPWLKIDDVFFRGAGLYLGRLMHTLKALEVDFAMSLQNKNALVSLKQIIRELENTQAFIWSPMILNGTGFWADGQSLADHGVVYLAGQRRDHRSAQSTAVARLRWRISTPI
jgi:hypothetical protein